MILWIELPRILICSPFYLKFWPDTQETWEKPTLSALNKLLETLTLLIECLRDTNAHFDFPGIPYTLSSAQVIPIFFFSSFLVQSTLSNRYIIKIASFSCFPFSSSPFV